MPRVSRTSPKGPEVGQLVATLEAVYGPSPELPASDPIEELVACILSQHTSDANSHTAFARLREACPKWEDVVALGPDRLAELIWSGGLARQKAKTILAALRLIGERNGSHSLENLRDLSLADARAWLESLPGVGPKTAAIVLCFSLGRPIVPVDTHVHRVSLRLGLLPPKTSADRAHDVLLESVPPYLAYRFHMALIRHGRAVCKARLPRCRSCPLANQCPKVGVTPTTG